MERWIRIKDHNIIVICLQKRKLMEYEIYICKEQIMNKNIKSLFPHIFLYSFNF